MIGFAAVFRLGIYQHRVLPIAFGVPLVLFGWVRSRRYLWVAALAFFLITLIKFFLVESLGPDEGGPSLPLAHRAIDAVMVSADMFLIAIVVHVLIGVQDRIERRNAELAATNRELAAREEEIARQNEELQSQAEELERQSEELRVSNEDLAARERTLQALLALSRVLTTDLTREQTLERICQTMGRLINGPTTATAILEQRGGPTARPLPPRFRRRAPRGHRPARTVVRRDRARARADGVHRGPGPPPRPARPAAARGEAVRLGAGRPAPRRRAADRDAGGLRPGERRLVRRADVAAGIAGGADVRQPGGVAPASRTCSRSGGGWRRCCGRSPFGIAIANADCSDVRHNPAGAALFNLPVDLNVAQPEIAAAVARRGRRAAPSPPSNPPLAVAVREGRDIHGLEVEVFGPAGRRLILLANAAPVRDRDGRVVGGVSAFADITPQKELQRELDLRRREAEEAAVRKTRFLAAVSHDIRTPANAISLLAELIRRTAGNPAMAGEVPELAQELHGSAVSLVNLLSDVLDVARFDSGKIELQETEFPLGALLTEELRQMQPLAREKGLDWRSRRRPNRRSGFGRTGSSSRACWGTWSATRSSSRRTGGSASKRPPAPDGSLAIRVIDTGIGIAPEHQRHIFDEFFQLRNPERDRNKGTGLGLTICKRLVEAMGGRLEVE